MTKPDRTNARRAWVLRKLALTRMRQKAWREQPVKMEAIRRQATLESKAVRVKKNEQLRSMIATWPKTMTPPELKQLVSANLEYAKRYSSLTYRFTRCGLLRFGEDGLWHNLCHLPDFLQS